MDELKQGESWNPFPDARFEDDTAHRREAHRALWLSALGLTLTGGIELAIALVSGSVGLLGDAIHNLSDVSTSLVGFVGFRVSKRPAAPSRPYGYERSEDMAGLGVAVVIWASAVFAGVVSIHKLIHHGGTTHLGLGMTAAVVGIVGNQIVARYKKRWSPDSIQHPFGRCQALLARRRRLRWSSFGACGRCRGSVVG